MDVDSFSLETPGDSRLLRGKKRKRAERRAAEFKELRQSGVNKIFPLARVEARPRKHAHIGASKGIWRKKRGENNEVAESTVKM